MAVPHRLHCGEEGCVESSFVAMALFVPNYTLEVGRVPDITLEYSAHLHRLFSNSITPEKSRKTKMIGNKPKTLLLTAQIRAARALLGWSQGNMAEGIGMTRPTIVTLESGKREPRPATLFVLMKELTAAGVVFTKRGVEFRNWPTRRYVPTGIKKKKRRS